MLGEPRVAVRLDHLVAPVDAVALLERVEERKLGVGPDVGSGLHAVEDLLRGRRADCLGERRLRLREPGGAPVGAHARAAHLALAGGAERLHESARRRTLAERLGLDDKRPCTW